MHGKHVYTQYSPLIHGSSAEDPYDYEAISTRVTFDDCSRRQCATLYIADDDKVEETESLIVLLNRPSGLDRRVELVDTVSTVVITDVDSRDLCVCVCCVCVCCVCVCCVYVCVYSSVEELSFENTFTFQASRCSWRVRVLKLKRVMVVSMCV